MRTNKEYKKNYTSCPRCHNPNVDWGKPQMDADTVWVEASCRNCNLSWQEFYKLTGYEPDVDRVVFRKWKDNGDIIALLVDQPANPGAVMSYMHLGQHGEADYLNVIHHSVRAKPAEYADLMAELISVGYELSTRWRWNGRRK